MKGASDKSDRATCASTEPASSLGLSAGIPSAKRRFKNHYALGPVIVRVGSKNLAPWGFPRLQVYGLSFWSRTNTGGLHLVSYHPRGTTWRWYVGITNRSRGYAPIFSKAERDRLAALHAEGNQYVARPRWWHRFVQPDGRRSGQWHDYVRLPLGYALQIGRQDYHKRRPA